MSIRVSFLNTRTLQRQAAADKATDKWLHLPDSGTTTSGRTCAAWSLALQWRLSRVLLNIWVLSRTWDMYLLSLKFKYLTILTIRDDLLIFKVWCVFVICCYSVGEAKTLRVYIYALCLQVFHRITAPSYGDLADARFEFFKAKVRFAIIRVVWKVTWLRADAWMHCWQVQGGVVNSAFLMYILI